jgi:hypothetical protein
MRGNNREKWFQNFKGCCPIHFSLSLNDLGNGPFRFKSTTTRKAGGLNLSANELWRIFGHRPNGQKHFRALNGALATGCKAPGL